MENFWLVEMGIFALVCPTAKRWFVDTTEATARSDVPVFVTMMLSCIVCPTRTPPNEIVVGIAVNPGLTPLPITVTVSGVVRALCTKTMLPV